MKSISQDAEHLANKVLKDYAKKFKIQFAKLDKEAAIYRLEYGMHPINATNLSESELKRLRIEYGMDLNKEVVEGSFIRYKVKKFSGPKIYFDFSNLSFDEKVSMFYTELKKQYPHYNSKNGKIVVNGTDVFVIVKQMKKGGIRIFIQSDKNKNERISKNGMGEYKDSISFPRVVRFIDQAS